MTDKEELKNRVGWAISRWQDSVEDFDGALGDAHALSQAERRCLSAVGHGPQTAGDIARETRLTRAATTTLIDRLEARGFVTREADPDDRRKVMVVAADKTRALIDDAFGPLMAAGMAILDRRTAEELTLILSFIEDVTRMQIEQTRRIRDG